MSMRLQHLPLGLALAVLAVVLGSTDVLACAICYGEPGNPMTMGVQNGVLLMLAAIGTVLAFFVALIVVFIRRSRRMARETQAGEATA